MTVGTHHGAHEIKLHESNGISVYNQVFAWLKVVSGIFSVHNWQVWRSDPIGA
jgi:hypothetical protein